ncbi:MAG TPA: hypothetical protein VHA73_15505 [Acidimicrobiales bacterium]|nr:hypothetical protein [Acidimicrobiales bacterium]
MHGLIYFAPEGPEEYAAAGVPAGTAGYFASRSAPLGAVPVEVVIATFFNFHPALVRRSMDGVWAATTPARVLQARTRVADRALRAALGELAEVPEVVEAARLARRAAQAAADHCEGRPLFAAHAALDWPDDPLLELWHAQTLLREFRGDAHIGALVAEDISAVEALVVHAATGDVHVGFLRASRSWPDEDWDAAVDRLRARGLLEAGDDLALTSEGVAHRQRVEDATDRAAIPAYDVLGDDGCIRLRDLARPLARAVVDRGFLNPARVPATQ